VLPVVSQPWIHNACVELFKTIAREGNVEHLKAEAHVGILKGTAVDPKDDPEELEDPYMNFILPQFRKDMEQLSANELKSLKSQEQDYLFAHC
jgi:hypothetical protein